MQKKQATDSNWYVLYTKSRHEKKVADMLLQKGFEAFCPLKTVTKVWSDRKKKVEAPLFNSYLFVKLRESELRQVFSVPGVVRYIYWCGKPAIVKDHEIDEIKRWLNVYDHEAIEVSYYNPNDKVKILSGNFINQEAKIIRQNGSNLVMYLEGLGIKLLTKLDNIILEKAS
ncbi:UpxY family transcription antiterminator [Lacihabitans sp. LS3-19]|uniref:UpxY family transcription antiterminator n=1 Tax=Lacihabitans sp. LS3-19 TaxID=2487335 RepID=UPI0020CFD6B2|nr:UpxY family transcription antiterminator [Lacihabitans sp. LS3-19]